MNDTYKKLELVTPDFDSRLASLIIELERMREKKLGGTTEASTFFQLKKIFHIFESVGSARIEGNNTTVAEYIEITIEDGNKEKDENIVEIENSERAMDFIDNALISRHKKIDRAFISDIHKIVTKDLSASKEGSKTPGDYRKVPVVIKNSKHKPADYIKVPDLMEELIDFINVENEPKYDLLKTAIAHHRFAWIHPFDNGNGRSVRLFTYAMLVNYGFNVEVGRIINPTAVFCIDRNKYYDALAKADDFSKEGLLSWCEYVLSGLKREIEKIYKLADYQFLKTKILLPALDMSLNRKVINDEEYKILKVAVEKQVFQFSDISPVFADMPRVTLSRKISALKKKEMIMPQGKSSIKYVLCFGNKYLRRDVVEMLDKNGFLPANT
ncbi:MAG: Fic family protein [Candidatus Pacebacteria bacterium]|nr:Fic family protein [Candidatus Paceibacterota bacterium]